MTPLLAMVAAAVFGATGGSDPCLPYAASQAAHDWCMASHGAMQVERGAMLAACAASGPWEARCHTMWVEHLLPMSGPQARDVLLETCIESDCKLRVLDTFPDADVRVQVDRCVTHAGAAATYCATHAYTQWAMRRPSAEEIARLAAAPTSQPEALASGIARAVGCWGVGACPAALEPLCSNTIDMVQREHARMCTSRGDMAEPPHTGWARP